LSSVTADLEARQAALLARCAREREQVALEFDRIAAVANSCDAGLAKLRRWLQGPTLLAAGIALVWGFRRTAGAGNISAVLGLLGIAMRLRSMVNLPEGSARARGH